MKLSQRIHQINLEKGFYDPPASRARRWMLIASELFEAIEGLRENNFNPSLDESRKTIKASCACEMADAYIRVLDFMEYERIDHHVGDNPEILDDPAEEIFEISKIVHAAWGCKDSIIHMASNMVKFRIETFCAKYEIDLMAFVEWKLSYNSKREYKHGKE